MSYIRGALSRLNQVKRSQPGLAPAGMPQHLLSEYQSQRTVYDLLWQIFDGRYWEQVSHDQKHYKWPLRINLAQASALIHTATWAGDLPDTSEPIAKPHLEPKKATKKASRDALLATDAINQVWYENNGRSLLMSANTVAQAVGGVVLRLRLDSNLGIRRQQPIRIEPILPDYFIGIPDAEDYYNLVEAWLFREIPLHDAERMYGYSRTSRDSDMVQMVEHWTPHTFRIEVNGQVAKFRNVVMEGANQYGFVPMVYFPHIRHAGVFAGIPLFAQLLGLAEELNGRMANEGDMILRNIRAIPWIRNVRSKLSISEVGSTRFLNLGTGTAASGAPEIGQYDPPDTSGSLANFSTRIHGMIQELSFTPEVVWGTDSGSQRSGESRERLLLPLTMHISMEREFWTPGLSMLSEMILHILAKKGLMGVTEDSLHHRICQAWHPMYPADRAKLVEEMVVRASAHLASPSHALEQLGDVEDLEAEVNRIKEWMQFQSDLRSVPLPDAGRPDRSALEGN